LFKDEDRTELETDLTYAFIFLDTVTGLSKLYVNNMRYMGIKTWWLEATTYGYIKAARKIDITIICGTEVITCHACYKRTVVYDRNIRDPTPYYEVQSLSNPNIPVDKGWFAGHGGLLTSQMTVPSSNMNCMMILLIHLSLSLALLLLF